MNRLVIAFTLFSFAFPLFAWPVNPNMLNRRVAIASEVVYDRMLSPYSIPLEVYRQAQCVASIRVVKAGFIWGGEGSTGLVSCRTENGEWSTPSFLNTGGVNFGFQIGVQFLDSVLMFMSAQGRHLLETPSFQLGGDLDFAAGPVGGGVAAGVIPKAGVLTYNRNVGLYAGATVQGFILSPGYERNAYVYGQGVQTSQILRAPGSKYAPAMMRPFVDTLNRYIP